MGEYDEETLAAAGITSNEYLDRDAFERIVSELMRNRNGPLALARAAVKAAMKTEKRIKGEYKKLGGKLKNLEFYLYLRDLEDEDTAVENAEDLVQVLEWGELLQGEQGSLLGVFDRTLSDTPMEAEERWKARGYKDIREGALDPEGFFNEETGQFEPAAIMPGLKPSYCPDEFFQFWAEGAQTADEKNMADFLAKQESLKTTPVEEAAKEKPKKTKAAKSQDHIVDSVLREMSAEDSAKAVNNEFSNA